MSVVSFESAEEMAFRAYIQAREKALETGSRDDAQQARRLFAVYVETGLPNGSRWPRDPQTLRVLTPSEIMRGRP